MARTRKTSGRQRATQGSEPSSAPKDDDAKAKAKGKGKPEKQPEPLLEWVKSIAIAVVLFLFLRTFIVQTFIITSGSMEETLLVGDMLVVNRLGMGSRIPGTQIRIPGYSSPRHGDVIVFDPPHDDTLKLIKRLVGMGGDTLELDVAPLLASGHARHGSGEEASINLAPVVGHEDTATGEAHRQRRFSGLRRPAFV